MNRMKLLSKQFGALLFLGLSMKLAVGQQADAILGTWYAEELEKSTIEMKVEDEKYFGMIINSADPDYVGKKVVFDLVYQSDETNYTGRIYAISRKMELDGTFTLEDDKLKVVGKKFFMTKTFFWTRIE